MTSATHDLTEALMEGGSGGSGLLGALRTQDISHAAGAGHILTQLAVVIRDFSWTGEKVSELNQNFWSHGSKDS